MQFPTPKIHTITTIAEAVDAGCDCVSIKFDGWPIAINSVGTEAFIYSDLSFKDAREQISRFTPIEPCSALYVGARKRGDLTPTNYLYDLWWTDEVTLTKESYRSRYIIMRREAKKLGPGFEVVHPMPLASAHDLWKQCLLNGHKGLVFRRSRDASAGDLYVIRAYAELPRELT